MRNSWSVSTLVAVILGVAFCTAAPVSAQTCAPLNDGHLADAFYQGTAIFWNPVVEYQQMVLTISGPCEEITRVFGPSDQIFFDIRDIQRVTDGQYTWQLRRVSSIDPGVQKDLEAARGTGEEDALWWSYFQSGQIPAGPYVESASFFVLRGEIIDPTTGTESQKRTPLAGQAGTGLLGGAASALGGLEATASQSSGEGGNQLAAKDFVIVDDLIVDGSACIGFDCVNGESFGFDTIRLKENNLRIQFSDTSVAASFPRNNWQIRANSSANGGASYLGFVDQGTNGNSETGDLVFAVEANAPTNALYVDDGGRVGFGTSSPSVELHTVNGDTPTLRLQQDGSSGFAPQTWDVAGNETSFFVRDATNGSTLPFRIRPGASSNSLVIDSDDDVGIGALSPDTRLHVKASDGSAAIKVQETNTTASDRNLLTLENNGPPTLIFNNSNAASNGTWSYTVTNGGIFQVNASGSGLPIEMQLSAGGNMTIGGTLTENSSRTVKTAFEDLNSREVLNRLVEIPVTVWSYRHDEDGTRHIGPMAEDFFAAFAVGEDNKHIAPSDKAGVALAAIQGLHAMVQERDQQIEQLNRDKEALEERIAALEALVARALDQ